MNFDSPKTKIPPGNESTGKFLLEPGIFEGEILYPYVIFRSQEQIDDMLQLEV